jgi:hypothetical protein
MEDDRHLPSFFLVAVIPDAEEKSVEYLRRHELWAGLIAQVAMFIQVAVRTVKIAKLGYFDD